MIHEPDCALVPKLNGLPGVCDLATCGKPLPPRRRRWCSNRCSRAYHDGIYGQHDWGMARRRALERDNHRCVRCGSDGKPPKAEIEAVKARRRIRGQRAPDYSLDALFRRYQLEVNHIVPRVGRGYGMGCHNHLDNLETLCHRCHVAVTNEQRRRRRAA